MLAHPAPIKQHHRIKKKMNNMFSLSLTIVLLWYRNKINKYRYYGKIQFTNSTIYPEMKKGTTFIVFVRALLNKDGRNENCQIVSSGNPHLNETTLKMCRESKLQLGHPSYALFVGQSRLMRYQFSMAD